MELGLSLAYSFLSFLFWPMVIIFVIILLVRKRRSKNDHAVKKSGFLLFTDSPEAELSHWFIFLAVPFFGITLLSINQSLGQPIAPHYILLAMTIVGFASAYFFRAILTLLLSMISILSWIITSGITWYSGNEFKPSIIVAVFVFTLLAFYIVGQIHANSQKFRHFSKLLIFLSMLLVILFLFLLSSEASEGFVEGITKGKSMLNSWQMTTTFLFGLAGVLGLLVYGIYKKILTWPEFLSTTILIFLFAILSVWQPLVPFSVPKSARTGEPMPFYNQASSPTVTNNTMILPRYEYPSDLMLIIFNTILFFQIFGVIINGYIRRDSWYVNLGAVMLFMFIIVKYFDWFFSFLDKSIFFIIAGLLLFGVGWFMEKGRKMVITNIKTDLQKSEQNSL